MVRFLATGLFGFAALSSVTNAFLNGDRGAEKVPSPQGTPMKQADGWKQRQDDGSGSCQSLGNGPYTDSNNQDYTVQCNYDHGGGDLQAVSANSFQDCFPQCDATSGCVGFAYLGGSGAGTCYLKSQINSGGPNANADFATSSSAASTTGGMGCEAYSDPYTDSNGQTYDTECGTDHNGGDLSNAHSESFGGCFGICDKTVGCIGFAYVGGSGSGTCYLKNSTAPASSNADVDCAFQASSTSSSAPASSSTSSAIESSSTLASSSMPAQESSSAPASSSSVPGSSSAPASSSAAPASSSPSSAPASTLASTASVVIPSVATPSVATLSIATPSAATPSLATLSVTIPSVAIPSASVATPSVATQSVAIPSASVATRSVAIPSVATPSVGIPSRSVDTLSIATPSVATLSVAIPSASVATPSVAIPSASQATPSIIVPSVSVATPSVASPSAAIPSASVATQSIAVPSASVATPSVATSAASVANPSVAKPSIATLSVATLSVATLSTAVPSASVPAPSVAIPSVASPSVAAPSVATLSAGTPSIATPSIATPSLVIPTAAAPSISVPSLASSSIATPSIVTRSAASPSVATPSVAIPSIPSVAFPSVATSDVSLSTASRKTTKLPATTVAPIVSAPSVFSRSVVITTLEKTVTVYDGPANAEIVVATSGSQGIDIPYGSTTTILGLQHIALPEGKGVEVNHTVFPFSAPATPTTLGTGAIPAVSATPGHTTGVPALSTGGPVTLVPPKDSVEPSTFATSLRTSNGLGSSSISTPLTSVKVPAVTVTTSVTGVSSVTSLKLPSPSKADTSLGLPPLPPLKTSTTTTALPKLPTLKISTKQTSTSSTRTTTSTQPTAAASCPDLSGLSPFLLQSNVTSDFQPFKGYYLQKPPTLAAGAIPLLTHDVRQAATVFYNTTSCAIVAKSETSCNLYGLQINAAGGSSYGECTFVDDQGAPPKASLNRNTGKVDYDDEFFGSWLACMSLLGTVELKFWQSAGLSDIDTTRCSKVDMIAQNL